MKLTNTLIILQATASAELIRLGSPEVSATDDVKKRVGLFYGRRIPYKNGTRTKDVAHLIGAETGLEAIVFDGMGDNFDLNEFDSIIVGTPTYNTGASDYRSMTGWDDWLYDVLPNVDISGKNVAIFCTGRMGVGLKGYPENFGDAAGELYERFAERGTNMFGFTSTDGFNFTRSKAIRNGKFIGKLFDHKNQPELSEGRAKEWVQQLRDEGFF